MPSTALDTNGSAWLDPNLVLGLTLPSVVGPKSLDSCPIALTQPLDLGPFVSGDDRSSSFSPPVVADREGGRLFRVVLNVAPSRTDVKLINEMIQGGSNVVEAGADEQREIRIECGNVPRVEAVAQAIRVSLDGESTSIRFANLPDEYQMAIGPPQFFHRVGKATGH